MTIAYLYPSEDIDFGTYVTNYPEIYGAGTFHEAVDDPVNAPDDDITYISIVNSEGFVDLGCYLPNDIHIESIEYVRFWLRGARSSQPNDQARTWVHVTLNYPISNVHYDDNKIISIYSFYPNYETRASAIFYNNPATGQPWIIADLNPLAFRIYLETVVGGGVTEPARVTQAYVELSYNPAPFNNAGPFLLINL